MKQRSFFDSKSQYSSSRISYGGKTKGRAKVFRPLDSKRPLHIVMKSSQAKGNLSLLKKRVEVSGIIHKWAQRCEVDIHRGENMGNHLHLMVSFKTRKGIQKFLRVISGLIARLITKAEKGRAFGQKFWDELIFTRIIAGFRDQKKMRAYFNKNSVERDSGQALRYAMEMYESVTKQARKRGVDREIIYQEMLAES